MWGISVLSFLPAAESVLVFAGLVLFGAASVRLLTDCGRVSSVGKQGRALTSVTGGSVTLVASCAFGWIRRSLSRAGARLGPLSVVLTASSPLRGRHSLLESCANIQRSTPFTPSAISTNWSTFAAQRRKPLW